MEDVLNRVKKAGYEIPTATLELPLVGITCANCANTIERSLLKVDGVAEAAVNFANERATLTTAVRKAEYDIIAVDKEDEIEDPEAVARQEEVRHQWQRFIIGAFFTIPLVVWTMLRDF